MRLPIRRFSEALVIALSITFAVTAASAQTGNGGFRRVASEPFSGRVVLMNRLKTPPAGRRVGAVSVRVPVNAAWQKVRPVLIQLLATQLNERNIGSGFRTSRNELFLAENGTLFIGTDGSGFTLRYVLTGNTLATSIRIPGPSPSGSDPRFAINFDAEVSIDVSRTGSGGIAAGPAQLKLSVKRPDGQNITGSLTVAVNDLIKFMSGTDFIGQGLSLLNNHQYALSPPVNLELERMLAGLTTRKTIITPRLHMNDSGSLKGTNELQIIVEDDDGGPIVH